MSIVFAAFFIIILIIIIRQTSRRCLSIVLPLFIIIIILLLLALRSLESFTQKLIIGQTSSFFDQLDNFGIITNFSIQNSYYEMLRFGNSFFDKTSHFFGEFQL